VTLKIVWAWIFTIPAAALCAAFVYEVSRLFR
jgi:phosphate/sulfate permease